MEKKNCHKKISLIIFALILTSTLIITSVNVSAATAKQNALKDYNTLLSRSSIRWGKTGNLSVKLKNCKFALAYIDNNNIPELILQNFKDTYHVSGYGQLYTYKNGKATFVKTLSLNDKFYYYKKKGIYIDNYSNMGYGNDDYIKLSSGKTISKLSKGYEYVDNDRDGKLSTWYNKYVSSNKLTKISKKTFNKELKTLVGTTKKSEIKLYANTKVNRLKYLK